MIEKEIKSGIQKIKTYIYLLVNFVFSIPIYFKYILREFLLSFFICFVFFFFIFFANQILLLAEHILSKRVPLIDVILLLIYFMPTMISFSFPFAALVGCLMAVSRLSADNEILSMQSLGISHKQIFLPVLLLSIIFTASSFIINDYFLPAGRINYTKLYRKMLYSNPELELESFSVKKYIDTVLITGEVKNKNIDDIVIIDRTNEGNKRFIIANNAILEEDKNGTGIISFSLNNVFSHYVDQKKELDYNYIESEEMIYNILLSDFSSSIKNLGPHEMSSYDVYKAIKEREKRIDESYLAGLYSNDSNYLDFKSVFLKLSSLKTIDNNKNSTEKLEEYYNIHIKTYKEKYFIRSLQIFKLEFNKKFALPAACIFFILFAYPASLFSTRRSGKSIGFGIGLIVSLFYWCIMFVGHTLGVRTNFLPVFAMWIPNIVIFIMSAVIFFIRFLK